MKLLLLALTCLAIGCAAGPSTQTGPGQPAFAPANLGRWSNLYSGNPNLAAVAVMPGLPNPYDRWSFAHLRPSGISYAFWDGRVRQIQYRGDGSAWDDFWWPPKAWLKPGSRGWAGFDFAYGSDPTFLRHRDPRLAPATGPATAEHR